MISQEHLNDLSAMLISNNILVFSSLFEVEAFGQKLENVVDVKKMKPRLQQVGLK